MQRVARPGCVRLRGGSEGEDDESSSNYIDRLGGRVYDVKQELLLYIEEEDIWSDVIVMSPPAAPRLTHCVQIKDSGEASSPTPSTKPGERVTFLSTWNHSPNDVAASLFEQLRKSHGQGLQAQHNEVSEPLSGRQLSIIKDCVALSLACAQDAAPLWMETASHWSDASKLAVWLLGVQRMKPRIAKMVSRLLELRGLYNIEVRQEIQREIAAKEAADAAARKDAPRAGPPPAKAEPEGPAPREAITWLLQEIKEGLPVTDHRKVGSEPFLDACEALPAPWSTPAVQMTKRLLDALSQLPRKFEKEMNEHHKKLLEFKHLMEEQQRTRSQDLLVEQKRAKVDMELIQKDAREEHDAELKKQVQELPGDKREEFLRKGRDKMAHQQRIEMQKWQDQQEKDVESASATFNGMRVAVENTHMKERQELILAQRREPFKVLKSTLVAELEVLTKSTSVLVTAGPAAGKTCLISQVVLHVLNDEKTGVVPIVIMVHHLQRQLIEHPKVFASADNFVEAHLQLLHGETSDMYKCLCLAVRARRALLLFDGIDEGGQMRTEIQTHILKVLAPQGHTILVASRPAGLDDAGFSEAFYRVNILPLSESQQVQVIKLRVPSGGDALLTQYVRGKLPRDEAGLRITSNPLMLSVIISLFQSRQQGGETGKEATGGQSEQDMPETMVELYKFASTAMLDRLERRERSEGSKALTVVPQLSQLLQDTVFEAHLAQQRLLETEQVVSAALRLFDPKTLASVKRRTTIPRSRDKPKLGDWVQVTKGDFKGECGKLADGIQLRNHEGKVVMQRYSVEFPNDVSEAGLALNAFISSGLDEAGCRAWVHRQRGPALLEACDVLPIEVREAVHVIVDGADEMVKQLLASLEKDPMRTFQEYFVARALCGGVNLRDAPPWRWTIWWENTLQLGTEMGDQFRYGLRRAAGIPNANGGHLGLRGKVGGDRSVSLLAIGQLLRVVETADLSGNNLGPSGAQLLASAIAESSTLRKVNLSENKLGSTGAQSLIGAIASSLSLIQVDLRANSVGPKEEARLREIATERRKLRHQLDIYLDAKPTLVEYE